MLLKRMKKTTKTKCSDVANSAFEIPLLRPRLIQLSLSWKFIQKRLGVVAALRRRWHTLELYKTVRTNIQPYHLNQKRREREREREEGEEDLVSAGLPRPVIVLGDLSTCSGALRTSWRQRALIQLSLSRKFITGAQSSVDQRSNMGS